MRTLTITAVEWASTKDGTLWIVRERNAVDVALDAPPAEFVLACAPCGTCHSTRRSSEWDVYDMRHNAPCPDCCIELVGSCPTCEGDTNDEFHPCAKSQRDGQHCNCSMEQDHCHWCGLEWLGDGEIDCPPCKNTKTATLGYAYAVGQPLPIAHTTQAVKDSTAVHLSNGKLYLCVMDGYRVLPENCHDITDRLSHYGPPESLVGQWALQLTLTGEH